MKARARAAFAALACVGLSLAACTVGPNYHPPSPSAPASFQEAGPMAGSAALAQTGDLSAWWSLFRDPVLDDLVTHALASNPDLQSAASRVRQARQAVRAAVGAELPSLSGAGTAVGFNSNRSSAAAGAAGAAAAGAPAASAAAETLALPSHENLFSVGFDATWEVDLFGGGRRAIESAKDQSQAAEWARRDGQVSLLAEIVEDYFTLRALQARIRIGQSELKRQEDLFSLIGDRRKAGFVTNLDVNQQSVQVATAAAELPELDAGARAQIHALGVLTGRPPEDLALELRPVDAALPAPPPVLQVGLPSELLRRRPDIREAERRLAAANAQIGVQTAKLYPSLDLVGLGSFAGTSAANLFSADNLQSIGVGALMAPIFNGGRSRAAIAEAKEVRAQALFAYEKTVLGAFRDVEDALARLRAEQSRLTQLQRSVEASRSSLKIAEDQYSAGLSTFINVLQSETSLLERQDQLTEAHAQALSDLASLYKALGGGYRDPATEPGSGSSAAVTSAPEVSVSAAAAAARRPEP